MKEESLIQLTGTKMASNRAMQRFYVGMKIVRRDGSTRELMEIKSFALALGNPSQIFAVTDEGMINIEDIRYGD